jgi:hypothetical protein
MPYRSKNERERPLWMTLGEAIQHVQEVDGCNRLQALSQLRDALEEGDIPARWSADPEPSLPPGFFRVGFPPLFAPGPIPTDPVYWRTVLVLPNGLVIDQGTLDQQSAGRSRQLFLLRSKINELWPLQSKRRESAYQAVTSDRSTARQQASKEQIRKTAREVYCYEMESGKKPPNLAEAEHLIRERVEGATRPRIRSVLNDDEFKRLRLKRGAHRKL